MASEIYGYIYKVVHLPTDRYYIGQRKLRGADPEEDGYYGSGVAWRNILNAHPVEEFEKEILAYASSQEELNQLEYVYIGDKFLTDSLCMNRRAGGDQPGMCEETKRKISEKNQGKRSWNTRPDADEIAHRISIHSKGKIIPDWQREKISLSRKGKNTKEDGNMGSQDYRWYNDGSVNIYINVEPPAGFKSGRITPWMQKGKR